MFAVGWGELAVERMERAARSGAEQPERTGPLAVVGAQGAREGSFSCWICGRLTNTKELCERFGLPLDSDPSTLLARVHAKIGSEASELLRGTFIVVSFDHDRQVATIVRDHLGGRPLVYARVGSSVLLAEHERAILDLLPSTPAPDRLALTHWIEHGSIPGERTLFDGIRRIRPAHRMLLSADAVTLEPYWRPLYGGTAVGSRGLLAERLRSAAFAAVERAAQGAHKPALSLSGGLDSACVAAGLAAQGLTGKAIALAGVFPDHPETDERELIEATARHTGLSVELFPFDGGASVLQPALEHIDRWSLPPVTPNLFVWGPMMARARELGVDAMLDGEGGDELFGFAPYLIADMLRAGRLLEAWRLTQRIPEIGSSADLRIRLRALRKYGASRLVPDAVSRRRRKSMAASGSLLSASDASVLEELAQEESGKHRLDGPLWWREQAESLTGAGERLGASAHLRRQATSQGIDRRHPFLFDLDLLTAILTSPPQLLFEIRDRALLRDGLDGLIPEAVRARPEKSFFTDLLAAGLVADGALLNRGPSEHNAPVRAFVRSEALEQLLAEEPSARGTRATRRLWHVGLADIWLRALEQPGYPHELADELQR